jgi:hypothetical protein
MVEAAGDRARYAGDVEGRRDQRDGYAVTDQRCDFDGELEIVGAACPR